MATHVPYIMFGVMGNKEETAEWSYVVEPVSGWFDVRLSDVWRYKDLIVLFVKRDFVAIYKHTILGPIWFLIQPLLTAIAFTVVFAKIAKIPTDGAPPPLFYLAGIIAWNYFASCISKTGDSLAINALNFRRVWFPRLTVPISTVISNAIVFVLQFFLFLCFYLYYYWDGAIEGFHTTLLLIPLFIAQIALMGLGFGIIISSLTTLYRDLTYLLGFAVQLWMLITPIFFPSSVVPPEWKWIVVLNPIAPLIENFRAALLGGDMTLIRLGWSTMIAIFLLIIGVALFSRVEKSFMDRL